MHAAKPSSNYPGWPKDQAGVGTSGDRCPDFALGAARGRRRFACDAALARELKMVRVIVPRIPGVLAAAGLLRRLRSNTRFRPRFRRSYPTSIEEVFAAALAANDARAAKLMQAEQLGEAEIRISYFADICYVGQSYTLEIPLPVVAPTSAQRSITASSKPSSSRVASP